MKNSAVDCKITTGKSKNTKIRNFEDSIKVLLDLMASAAYETFKDIFQESTSILSQEHLFSFRFTLV